MGFVCNNLIIDKLAANKLFLTDNFGHKLVVKVNDEIYFKYKNADSFKKGIIKNFIMDDNSLLIVIDDKTILYEELNFIGINK